MDADDIVRRVGSAVRNAVVWGGAWFTLGTVVAAAIRLADGVPPIMALADGVFMGTKIGFIGGIAGGAFSVFLSVFHRGRRLSEMSWLRFGVGGAILSGVLVPGFLLTANLISGEGLSVLPFVIDDGIWAAAFGGITAAGSIWLAQRAEALRSGETHEQLERPHGLDAPRERERASYVPRSAAK